MKKTLIIPALNEEGCIGQTLQEIPRGLIDEIIVVDGFSTDNTIKEARETLESTGQPGKVILRTKPGFGSAIREAAEIAQGDLLIFMDADGSQNPADLPRLLEIYGENTVAMASRYAKDGKSEDDTLIRGFGNRLFTKLANLTHGLSTSDCLYFFLAVSKANFQKLHLTSGDFSICIEFLIKAKRAGLTFQEIATTERPRLAGESKIHAFQDGLKILKRILRHY